MPQWGLTAAIRTLYGRKRQNGARFSFALNCNYDKRIKKAQVKEDVYKRQVHVPRTREQQQTAPTHVFNLERVTRDVQARELERLRVGFNPAYVCLLYTSRTER